MKNFILLFSVIPFLPFLYAHEDDHSGQPGAALDQALETGNGLWRYKVAPNWHEMPEGQEKLGALHGGVVVDKQGRIYLSTNTGKGILVFEPDGTFLKALGQHTQSSHNIQIFEEGGQEYLFIANAWKKKAIKLDLDGTVILEIEDTEEQKIPEGLKGITAAVQAPDGSIFVAVGYGSNLIHKFDPSGKLLKSFGSKGWEKGKFITCHGIAIDTRFDEGKPRLLISNRENLRLDHFDLDGNFIGTYASGFRRPCSVSIYGEYCAVAELQGRVSIVDKKGVIVAFLGDNPDRNLWAKFRATKQEMTPTLFTAPHGLAFDKDWNLYVQDWNETGRLTKLKRLSYPELKPKETKK